MYFFFSGFYFFFFFNATATTEIYTLSLHDALPIFGVVVESLPPGTGVATTRCARVAPDHAIIVELVEGRACCHDGDCFGIVVEPLPARAGATATGRTGVAPDHTVIVELV